MTGTHWSRALALGDQLTVSPIYIDDWYSLVQGLVVDVQVLVDQLSGPHHDHLVPETLVRLVVLVLAQLLPASSSSSVIHFDTACNANQPLNLVLTRLITDL